MEEIQQEKERAGQEERLEKKEPRKLFMRWEYKSPEKKVLAVPNLFFSDGRAFNINEARIPFSLDDSRPDALEVTVQVKINPPHTCQSTNLALYCVNKERLADSYLVG